VRVLVDERNLGLQRRVASGKPAFDQTVEVGDCFESFHPPDGLAQRDRGIEFHSKTVVDHFP
jgi:hypothetical protein